MELFIWIVTALMTFVIGVSTGYKMRAPAMGPKPLTACECEHALAYHERGSRFDPETRCRAEIYPRKGGWRPCRCAQYVGPDWVMTALEAGITSPRQIEKG